MAYRITRGDALEPGDIIVNADGEFEDEVISVDDDDSGTWVEFVSGDLGYIGDAEFHVEIQIY